jgi:hypothetical protein
VIEKYFEQQNYRGDCYEKEEDTHKIGVETGGDALWERV